MRYKIGNILRGEFIGNFKKNDHETAWKYLSQRFLLSYPSETGRRVQFYVEKENEFGIVSWILAKDEVTSLEKIADDDLVLKKCVRI